MVGDGGPAKRARHSHIGQRHSEEGEAAEDPDLGGAGRRDTGQVVGTTRGRAGAPHHKAKAVVNALEDKNKEKT